MNLPLHFRALSDHVVDQAMLVDDTKCGEFVLEFAFENLGEDVLEAAVIGLEDGVLGREVNRPFAGHAIIQAGAGEIADRILQIVHAHRDAGAGIVEHLALDRLAVRALPLHGELAGAGDEEIGRLILIGEGMAGDDDRVGPARDDPRHVVDHDRLAENGAAQDVADRAVGRFPHLLEAEFLDPRLVRRDRGAFDADAMLPDRVGGLDRDLVLGRVAAFDAEIVIDQVHVEIREDQPLADPLPDDPRHLVAIQFDDRILHLDLRHAPRAFPD